MLYQKLLIINADDFGLNESVNLGIMDAFNSGSIGSASLFVNMPATELALTSIKNSSFDKSIGIHLNISSGYCVSSPKSIEQIAYEDGRFRFDDQNIARSLAWLKSAISENKNVIPQIITEYRRQVEKFYNTGLNLNHIDVHHYLPLIHPGLFEAYAQLAEELHVPFRGECYPMIKILSLPEMEIYSIRSLIHKVKAPCPSYSISNLFDGSTNSIPIDLYRRELEKKLYEILQNQEILSVELIVHPFHNSGVLKNDDYEMTRELETGLINDSEFILNIKKEGYKYGSYSDL